MNGKFIFTAICFSLCLAGIPANEARAEKVSVNFTATVSDVNDAFNILGGNIHIGDTITGSYSYDTGTPPANSAPNMAEYWYHAVPYGVHVNVGSWTMETDPGSTNFLIQLANNYNGTDNYGLYSSKNVSRPALLNNAVVDTISWQLNDSTGTAIDSVSLPPSPPMLQKWQSKFGFQIKSCMQLKAPGRCAVDGFLIKANVTSATLAIDYVKASVEIRPDMLNRNSQGQFITGYIELPKDYAVDSVDVSSVQVNMVNGVGLAQPIYAAGPTEVGDHDGDGVTDLMVKLDRQKVIAVVSPGVAALTLTAKLRDGTPIQGSASIQVR